MPAGVTGALRWTRDGTTLFLAEADLGDAALGEPSALPGWTRRHLLAHVAANAAALGNLVHWAATGEPTPMYSSPGDSAAIVLAGPLAEITAYLTGRAHKLTTAGGEPAPALGPWL